MAVLLVSVVLSIIFAFFATQNTGLISLNFLSYTIPNVPIYLAIIVPILISLILAYFIHVARDLSQNLTLNEQKDEIKNLKNELAEVTKIAHKMQVENSKLKKEKGLPMDPDSI